MPPYPPVYALGFLSHLSSLTFLNLYYKLRFFKHLIKKKIHQYEKSAMISHLCPGNKLVAVFWRIFIIKKILDMKRSGWWKCFLASSTSKTTIPIILYSFWVHKGRCKKLRIYINLCYKNPITKRKFKIFNAFCAILSFCVFLI